jgi:GNAT superfamily N-acetyltransferase
MAIVAGISVEQATAALERNLWSMWSVYGGGDGCLLVDEPGILRFETPVPYIPYNSVVRFQLDERVDATIDEILTGYRARSVPVFWAVHPSARPADLGARLAARGLVEAEIAPGMVLRLEQLPPRGPVPEGIVIEQVKPTDRDPWIQVTTWRYSLPPDAVPTLRSIMAAARFGEPDSASLGWVARRDGVILSKVVAHFAADVVGIYAVATRPEARGLGLARLLTIHALEAARAAGTQIGVLHSTPMAVSLYEAIGFERVADFRIYVEPGSPVL